MDFESITLFLTDMSASELTQLESFQQYSESSTEFDLADDWQFEFSQRVGLDGHSIPWNLLRASQFQLPKNTRTIVCCDPVLMQMTHRGAYLWGQQGIDFSQDEVIRIIANINEKLMRDGENFYLLNNQQWLFTSDQEIELNLPSFENYIGKDMFGFSYPGKDGPWWDRLATEIQMLIKQMIDYQGLSSLPAEHLINVHFWGNTKARLQTNTSETTNSSHLIISNDSQFESLSHFYKIPYYSLQKLTELSRLENPQPCQLTVVVSRKKDIQVSDLFDRLVELVNLNKLSELSVVAADKQMLLTERPSILRKIMSFFKA